MATAAPERMTLAEFLDWDDGTDTHYELVQGEVVAMAQPSPAHGRTVGNLARISHHHAGARLSRR